MKSFFTFLNRNKAYTAINIAGLSISLMFLIIIAAFVIQETGTDRWHSNSKNIYALGFSDSTRTVIGSHWRMQFKLRDQFPEIVNSCATTEYQTNIKAEDASNDNYFLSNILLADSTFYSVFDFELELGNRKTALQSPNAAVITEELGKKLFGDTDPIGKTIKIAQDSTPAIVTAIMKPMKNTAFSVKKKPIEMIVRFERATKYNWSLTDERMSNASDSEVFLVAQDGIDLTSRASEYTNAAKSYLWLLQDNTYKLKLTNLNDLYFTDREYSTCLTKGDKDFINILIVIALVILAFAIMNYINLTVAQSSWRAKEMATRRLIGASRASIIWKMISESTMLTAISMLIAIGLSIVATPYASSVLEKQIDLTILISPATLATAILLVAIISISAGIIPAMLISSIKPIDIVRGTFRRHSGTTYSRIFIIIQNVIAIVMLICVTTIWIQTQHLKNAPLGFNTKRIVKISAYRDLSPTIKTELENLGCVEAVGLCNGTPIDGGNNLTVKYEGRLISNNILIMDTTALKIFGIKIEKSSNKFGRFVNHSFLRAYNKKEDIDVVKFDDGEFLISGIFKDFRMGNILNPIEPTIIKVVETNNSPWTTIIKIKGDEDEAWKQILDTYNKVIDGHGQSLAELVKTPFIEQKIKNNFRAEDQLLKIVAIFAFVAIIISSLGLIAMSSYYVNLHHKEIAIRKVYGATSNQELRRILRSFISNVIIATIIAIPIGWYIMADWLAKYSYRITLSWWIFAVASIICILISILVVIIQSSKAANSNPTKALYQN